MDIPSRLDVVLAHALRVELVLYLDNAMSNEKRVVLCASMGQGHSSIQLSVGETMTPRGWEGLDWDDFKDVPLVVYFICGVIAALVIFGHWL
jgi:hypothetical protein